MHSIQVPWRSRRPWSRTFVWLRQLLWMSVCVVLLRYMSCVRCVSVRYSERIYISPLQLAYIPYPTQTYIIVFSYAPFPYQEDHTIINEVNCHCQLIELKLTQYLHVLPNPQALRDDTSRPMAVVRHLH